MKRTHHIGLAAIFLLPSLNPASGQEEFSFKLYLESLANGKKDTLELGFSPSSGISGCEYDSSVCGPTFNPFSDTIDHIGAFAVQSITSDYNYATGTYEVYLDCPSPVFVKRWIADSPEKLYSMIVPYASLPVRIYWDSTLFQGDPMEEPLLTDHNPGGYPDAGQTTFHIAMGHRSEAYLMPLWSWNRALWDSLGLSPHFYNYPPVLDDSTFLSIPVEDSAGTVHVFRYFSIDYNFRVDNEARNGVGAPLSLYPNPASGSFHINSRIPVQEWKIYDISGRCVLSGPGEQTGIDCSTWHSGMYVFEWVSTHGQKGNVKLIIKN